MRMTAPLIGIVLGLLHSLSRTLRHSDSKTFVQRAAARLYNEHPHTGPERSRRAKKTQAANATRCSRKVRFRTAAGLLLWSWPNCKNPMFLSPVIRMQSPSVLDPCVIVMYTVTPEMCGVYVTMYRQSNSGGVGM